MVLWIPCSYGSTPILLEENRVVVNGTCSIWTEVGSGVPQGSILGPILFLLFVNDMPNVVSSARIAMFADDLKCYKIIEQASDFCKFATGFKRTFRLVLAQ